MNNPEEAIRTVIEPAREIRVQGEYDVVVVGGGPAGFTAATAAARNGARTCLMERYGHLGGMSTGGLVMIVMPMSDGTSQQQIQGICQEMIDRLDSAGAAIHPSKSELGSDDAERVSFWRRYAFGVVEGRVRMSATVDPEILKNVINDMVTEAGVKLLLHSWGVQALVEENTMRGVVFESKSGRRAVLGKVVIDATGDGDIYASAGAPFDSRSDPKMRSSNLALTFRLANIDARKYSAFKQTEPQKMSQMMRELESLGGFTMFIATTRDSIIWVNNNIPGLNPLEVEDLTDLEVKTRRRMVITRQYLQQHVPGFENCYILDTASQAGVRSSRRLTGEYVLTAQDLQAGTLFPDTIAVCPDFRHTVSPQFPHWHVPYRALVPQKIDGLLTAGRCYSSDLVANDLLAPIQCCIAMGQAAGTAAALAVQQNTTVRDLDCRLLQDTLRSQNVPLPDL